MGESGETVAASKPAAPMPSENMNSDTSDDALAKLPKRLRATDEIAELRRSRSGSSGSSSTINSRAPERIPRRTNCFRGLCRGQALAGVGLEVPDGQWFTLQPSAYNPCSVAILPPACQVRGIHTPRKPGTYTSYPSPAARPPEPAYRRHRTARSCLYCGGGP